MLSIKRRNLYHSKEIIVHMCRIQSRNMNISNSYDEPNTLEMNIRSLAALTPSENISEGRGGGED